MSTPVQTRAAASERAVRTFLSGLAVDVAVAVATALLVWLPGADLSTHTAWQLIGLTLIKTVLSTVASYVLRLKLPPATEVDGAFVITDLPAGDPARGDVDGRHEGPPVPGA